VSLGVGSQQLAVGGDDLGGQQVVDGQAVLADQVADPTAQGEAADPDRAGVAEPGGQPIGPRPSRVVAGGQARLGPSGPLGGVDVQRPQLGEVEDDAAVGGAVAADAVAAAADGQLQPGLAGQGHDPGDLGGVGGPDDDRRVEVESAVEHGAGLVVVGVAGCDHPAGKAGP